VGAAGADQVSGDEAWDHVAGRTVGQAPSERIAQLTAPSPQFSLRQRFVAC
jgi:hypothetical protein